LPKTAQTHWTERLASLKHANDIQARKTLTQLLIALYGFSDDLSTLPIKDCLNRTSTLLTFLYQEPTHTLQIQAEQYFRDHFGSNFVGVEFFEKRGGIQLGKRARITLKDRQHPIDYYVKTHRGGLLASIVTSISAGPKLVDPKELFVYKVFELIGLTPETHFFFDSAQEFYIATKDAGFDELLQKRKTFLTYGSLKDAQETQSSYAKMSAIFQPWKTAPNKTLEAAGELEKDLSVAELNIIKGLTTVDVLSRIFLLSDFTTNSDNIGFVLDRDGDLLRIIDFAVPETMRTYTTPDVFIGFLSGNGRHRYDSSTDELVKYILHGRQCFQRIQTAKELMSELATDVTQESRRLLDETTIDEAKNHVIEYVRPLGLDLSDLEDYVEGVKFNLEEFRKSLSFTDDHINHLLAKYHIDHATRPRLQQPIDNSTVPIISQHETPDDSQQTSGDDGDKGAGAVSEPDDTSSPKTGNHHAAINGTVMHAYEEINMQKFTATDGVSLTGIVSNNQFPFEIYSSFDEQLTKILRSLQLDGDNIDTMNKLEELEEQIENSQLTATQKKELRNRIETIRRLLLEDTYAHVSKVESIIDIDTKIDYEQMARIFGDLIIQDPSEKTHHNGTDNYFDIVRPVNSEIRQTLGSVPIIIDSWGMSSANSDLLGLSVFDKNQMSIVGSVERANRISLSSISP
jgi:hypothetical protein